MLYARLLTLARFRGRPGRGHFKKPLLLTHGLGICGRAGRAVAKKAPCDDALFAPIAAKARDAFRRGPPGGSRACGSAGGGVAR